MSNNKQNTQNEIQNNLENLKQKNESQIHEEQNNKLAKKLLDKYSKDKAKNPNNKNQDYQTNINLDDQKQESQKSLQKSHSQTSHLTGTIIDFQNTIKSQQIPVLLDQKRLIKNKQQQIVQQYQDADIEYDKNLNKSLKFTKIINDKPIPAPMNGKEKNVLRKIKSIRSQTTQQDYNQQNKAEQRSEQYRKEIFSNKKNQPHQQKYYDKMRSTTLVEMHKQPYYQQIDNFTQTLSKISKNQLINAKTQCSINSKTFDKTIRIQEHSQYNDLGTQTIDDLKQSLQQIEQFRTSYKPFIKQYKNTLITKGRYPKAAQSEQSQFINDRTIMRQNYQEQYDKLIIPEKTIKQAQELKQNKKQNIQHQINERLKSERIQFEERCKQQYGEHLIF